MSYQDVLRLFMEVNGITDPEEGELELLQFLKLQKCPVCSGYMRMIRGLVDDDLDDSGLARCTCDDDWAGPRSGLPGGPGRVIPVRTFPSLGGRRRARRRPGC